MRGWLAGSLLAALCSALFVLREARAQDAGAPKSYRPFDSGRRVDVNVVAGTEDARELVNTICEVVGRLGLPVNAHIVEQRPPESASDGQTPGIARVEIDLTSPSTAQVVVYGRGGDVVAMQRFARNTSSPVLREEIADAVRSAVEAQLLIEPEPSGRFVPSAASTGAGNAGHRAPARVDAAPAGTSPFSVGEPAVAEPPSLTPPPVALVAPTPSEAPVGRPSPVRWLEVDLSALAGVGDFEKRVSVVSRLGGEATVVYRKWLNPSLIIAGEYVVPFDTTSQQGVTAHSSIASMRVVPAIQVFHTPIIAIDVGAGVGIDVMNTRLASSNATATNNSPSTRLDPVLRGLAAAHLALAPRVAISLNIACDIDVATNTPGYYVKSDAGYYYVFSPFRVRPLALLGLTFAAFGEARLTSGIVQ
jgi:hypothetical protein